MNSLMTFLAKLGVLKKDLDYHLLRASMVVIFLFFGYQKWFQYEAQALIPYISHGPLIFWMYPVFGVRGATYFLGVSEWLFGALLFAGFWNKKLGVLGALGACGSFIATSGTRETPHVDVRTWWFAQRRFLPGWGPPVCWQHLPFF